MEILSLRKRKYVGKVHNLECTPDHIFRHASGIYVHNCGAGDFFGRSLTAEEIVSQPVRLLNDVKEETGVDPSQMGRLQIMFMSMGEPLLNLKNMIPALRELYRLYPKAALLISTIGPKSDYKLVEDISVEIPTIGLQFSVHESTDEARNKLIPFSAKLSLAQIAVTGEQWFIVTGRTPFFNYCAAPHNTSEEDADRLAALFDPKIWQATISVICERDESVARATERQKELADGFEQKLLRRGYSTRVFNPAGQDDAGSGCGQLWFVQRWVKDNPDKVKKSIGCNLPIIHSPGCHSHRSQTE